MGGKRGAARQACNQAPGSPQLPHQCPLPIIFLVQLKDVAGGVGGLLAIVDIQCHLQGNQSSVVL